MNNKIAKKGSWEAYNGWSTFEKDNLLKPYLETIRQALRDKKTNKLVSVGIGPGFPEALLLDEGVKIIGIDSNPTLLKKSEERGIKTILLDAFEIPKDKNLEAITDVLVTTFL